MPTPQRSATLYVQQLGRAYRYQDPRQLSGWQWGCIVLVLLISHALALGLGASMARHSLHKPPQAPAAAVATPQPDPEATAFPTTRLQ